MKTLTRTTTLFIILLFTGLLTHAQESYTPKDIAYKIENPLSAQYIKSKLSKASPRLILTPAIEKELKKKLSSDQIVKNYFEAIRLNSAQILNQPVLTRNVIGRRLLGTSREMLYRMTILSINYRLEKKPELLRKINDELVAVCNFTNWNPSHFLDVAEMSLAVSLAVDWVGEWLPKTTVEMAKTALIEKGIKPSFAGEKAPGWVAGTNNWNQVCNGGMIAAAITIAEKDPELAAKTISRSLNGIPSALVQYYPSGVYPEGATYWDYGTSFTCVTSSMLESAFGTDFGIAAFPAFISSADFRILSGAPSGYYYNFADCGDKIGEEGDETLAWFAKTTGNALYLEKEKFMITPRSYSKLPRLAGSGLIWLSQFKQKTETSLPIAWKGDGPNPVVFFRDAKTTPDSYYFGGKGGKASLSHGNMDAGSFIFELNGVRWVLDPGNQSYNALEQAGFDLWGSCQNCDRWSLLTKGNINHSTLSVNGERFKVNGHVPIIDFTAGDKPEATLNMTALYGGKLFNAMRKFTRDTERSLTVEDQIILGDSVKFLTWSLMTTSEVIPVKDGAVLKKDGKQLKLTILSPEKVKVSVIMLDPPPMQLDKVIENLKRAEIMIPAYIFPEKKGTIKVRLTSE